MKTLNKTGSNKIQILIWLVLALKLLTKRVIKSSRIQKNCTAEENEIKEYSESTHDHKNRENLKNATKNIILKINIVVQGIKNTIIL